MARTAESVVPQNVERCRATPNVDDPHRHVFRAQLAELLTVNDTPNVVERAASRRD